MGTLSIGKLAIQLTTPLLLRKPCKLFASVARVCQRQLGFLVPGYLRAPSADRRETLPRDRNLGALYNASPKIRGPSPQRNWGPITCKIRRDFRQLQTSIVNISGTGQDIQNRKMYWSIAISPAFAKKSGELWSTNYRELYVSLNPHKLQFSGYYISALRGCWPLDFNTH